ncbi:MAG: hypothetical protein HZA82_07370 [Thaumarchaeota archaeon]|nr:hypothetical protein [Nitrososphaerota archaeon]
MPTYNVADDKEIPTLAEMLYKKYQYDGIGFTIDALLQIRKSIRSLYPQSPESEQDKMSQVIKLEIIMKFCHFAENLAAIAITFNKKFDSSEEEMRSLFDQIYEYGVSDVIDFYEQIPTCDLDFIAKFLGFPPIKLQNEEARQKIEESCEIAKKKLESIGKNYLEFRSLYNAYKHGYRLFPGIDKNRQQDAFVFIDKCGVQKITTADNTIFDEITGLSRQIEETFRIILNHAVRAEMEKRGLRNMPMDFRFFKKIGGLPHNPNVKIMFPARGERRKRNLVDRERIYEKFKLELETKHMEKIGNCLPF